MSGVRPRLGISACLLGASVRYDGGHKREADLVADLDPHVTWIDVCPEVEIGLGVPRPPIQLEPGLAGPRLTGIVSRRDHTERMKAWADAWIHTRHGAGLDGFVLKARSPSCAPGDAPVRAGAGAAPERPVLAHGTFAARLAAAIPDLPVESEEALRGAPRRAGFLTRVFARAALRSVGDRSSLRHMHGRYRRLFELFEDAAGGALVRHVDADRVEAYVAHAHRILQHTPQRADHVRLLRGELRGSVSAAPGIRAASSAVDAYEAGTASLVGALRALRRGLEIDPDDVYFHPPAPVWRAYAEASSHDAAGARLDP